MKSINHELRLLYATKDVVIRWQVAPKEVLTTKGGLSPATARLLAQPPVPLQLSYVEAGSEFPDANCSLDSLLQQVLLSLSWSQKHS